MKANKPILTLNMDDKIYLAVAKTDVGKLSFVYTLACLSQPASPNTYDMTATREIHTFNDKDSAQLYNDTIERIIEVNANDKNKQPFFEWNEKLIEIFLENTK